MISRMDIRGTWNVSCLLESGWHSNMKEKKNHSRIRPHP